MRRAMSGKEAMFVIERAMSMSERAMSENDERE